MVPPPVFSAWSSFILGGLGGWRDGGERPPSIGPPSGVGAGPPAGIGNGAPPGTGGGPPGRPPFPPTFNSSGGGGPPFPISGDTGQGPPNIPALLTTSAATACSSDIPIATADAAPVGNYTIPANSSLAANCTLFDSPLTNSEQVGDSTWGTLCQPPLPSWLPKPDGTPYTSPPWGNHSTADSDPTLHAHIPTTNVTRLYDWTLSRSRISPDGVLRDTILVNNQFPGPMIEANWGDWISVTMHNNISTPEEGTALHWHGLLQRETPWMDGTPGVGQCPIAPGESYTYTFRAEVYGTTFWHAHYSAQYTAGAAGAMVIHGPSVRTHDIDIGPVMLSDWNHIPYFSMVANVVGTDFSKIPPLSDNGLINGRGRYNCSTPSYSNSTDWLGSYFDSDLEWTCVDGAPRSKFAFTSGKTHLLRLINQGADGIQKFSIDNHTMTVIATDFVPTQPYETDVVTLGVGQRTDVLVTAHLDPKAAVWMRTQLPGGPMCGGLGPYGTPTPPLGAPLPPDTVYPDVLAAIYYETADPSLEPTSTTTLEPRSCANDDLDLTRPATSVQPSALDEAYTLDLVMTLALNETRNFEWRTNDQAYRANFNEPILYDAAAGQTTFSENPEWNVYDLGENQTVILNVTNATPFTHPMHLHGHTFFVLAVGGPPANSTSVPAGPPPNPTGPPPNPTGPPLNPTAPPTNPTGPPPNLASAPPTTVWDGSIIHPENPMRRDVQIVPANGFIALAFEADNPGVWPFHCHVAWHLSSGLAVNLVSRAGEIGGIPEGTREGTCKAWDAYSAGTVVDQIDSGS